MRRIRGDTDGGSRYGQFDLKGNGGRCPFVSPEGLCTIQQACGHEALVDVCRTYPRHTIYSPAGKEYVLSPSCEGVLEELWNLPQGVGFTEEPLPKTEYLTVETPPEENLMGHYAAVHRTMLDILQNRALSVTERMLYLGITVQRLQKEDWTAFDPEKWRQQTISLMASGGIKETLEKITGNRVMYIMQNLKVLGVIAKVKREPWMEEIFKALDVRQNMEAIPDEDGKEDGKEHLLMDFSPKRYQQALAEYESAFSDREYFFENLMVAAALYMGFPFLLSPEDLWKGYVSLCNLYSFYRFTTILGCKGQATKERLFHFIVMASRITLHNRTDFQGFQEEMFRRDSSSLAHMAILLKG